MWRAANTLIMRIEVLVAALMLAVATSSIILQVFFRYFLRMPFSWPEELSMFLLNWITFLGASILLKRNGHIRVSFLVDNLPHRVRGIVTICLNLLMSLALTVMVLYGIGFFQIHNVSRTVALHIPRGYFSLPLILASLSMVSFLLQSMRDQVLALKNGNP